MKKIVNKLVMIQSTPLYLGNQEAFWLVNKGYDLVRDDVRKVALHVDYIDFDNPENNIFKVVNQYIPHSIFLGTAADEGTQAMTTCNAYENKP